jgi:hypothetical protein
VSHFSHAYTVADDFNAAARVLCMRCSTEIMRPDYIEMDKKNAPGQKTRAYVIAPNSKYRLAPVLVEVDDHVQMVHLPMCSTCDRDWEMKDADVPLIRKQLIDASVKNAAWCGYPKEAGLAEENRYNGMSFVKRVHGQELVDFYRKKPKEA